MKNSSQWTLLWDAFASIPWCHKRLRSLPKLGMEAQMLK
jgi:hypothetical protein